MQLITDKVDQLYVFQRKPNWGALPHNSKISGEEMADIKGRHDEIFERCRQTPGGFIHMADRRKLFEVPEDERLGFFESSVPRRASESGKATSATC